MPWFWLLSILCAALLAALWWALSRLHALTATAAAQDASPKENGRLTARLDALLRLHERGRAAAGQSTREALCQAVLETACSTLGAERAAMLVFDESLAALKPLAAVGAGSQELLGRSVPAGQGLEGRAFETGKAQRGAAPGEPFVSVPLVALAKPIGALSLYRTQAAGAPLDQADERFLEILAREAALTLHQLELLDSQESFTIEMLQVLARAAETKDQTDGRSERSRGMARRVAEGLRLTPAEVRRVEYAAMLHHVGKIGVDQALLSKPGKLSPNEYAQIKRYTTIGHEILSRSKPLEPVARIVLHQQEWFNGKGYPDGLVGDAIPIGSRIVAVVNAWEAMMQDRPYRKALSHEAAVAELRKGSGTQFDPAVVEAFLRAHPATTEAAA